MNDELKKTVEELADKYADAACFDSNARPSITAYLQQVVAGCESELLEILIPQDIASARNARDPVEANDYAHLASMLPKSRSNTWKARPIYHTTKSTRIS